PDLRGAGTFRFSTQRSPRPALLPGLSAGHPRRQQYLSGRWGVAMRGLMRRTVVVAGAAVVLLGPAAGVASAAGEAVAGPRLAAAAQAAPGGTWGTAEQVPGTTNENPNFPFTTTLSVSCASPGKCSAGGVDEDSSGIPQAFVVSR